MPSPVIKFPIAEESGAADVDADVDVDADPFAGIDTPAGLKY
jgi:hypothetical protein